MRIIIVGGGKIGVTLANWLIREKNEVVIIEKNPDIAEALAEKIDALILQGDGTSVEILNEADINDSDAIFALTGDDKTNLMICEIAKSKGVARIVSRINDYENEHVFKKIGINAVVNTTRVSAQYIKRVLDEGDRALIEYTANGNAEIFEIIVPENSKVINKSIKEIEKDFVVGCIYRNNKVIMRKPEEKIKGGDVLTIICKLNKSKDVMNTIREVRE